MFSRITSTDATRRRRRLVVVAGATLLILGSAATFSLLTRGSAAERPPVESGPASALLSKADRPASNPSPTFPPVLIGSDPEAFARQVAEALFVWDTDSMTTPVDLIGQLVGVADPTGESSAGLVADVANYLPTLDAWAELRRYETRQWIEIVATEIPSLWPTAVQQAGPDGFLPGTTAYTIRGVRHRSGVWEGEAVSTAHEMAFTVFVVCGPSYPECHLLRLSRPDEPLG
ncbi:hypothetical protein GCM10027020_12580 [Nocardioides salsibiostraticola]